MGVPYVMFKILGCSKVFYGRPDPIQIQLFIFKNEYDSAFGHSNEYRYKLWERIDGMGRVCQSHT